MLLAQVAQVGIGFVNTVMAGGAGKKNLAAVALGSSAFATVYITFMGIMAALNPMIAQLYGAGKTASITSSSIFSKSKRASPRVCPTGMRSARPRSSQLGRAI